MAYIDVKYRGKDTSLVYEWVKLTTRKDKEFIFKSGNFVKDWYEAKGKFVELAHDELYLTQLSSVDHFIMDGANFDSAWLVWDNDGENPRLVYEFTEHGWEMFVPKGTKPTWEELKLSIGHGKQKQLK